MRSLLSGIILLAVMAVPAARYAHAGARTEVALVNGLVITAADLSDELGRTLRKLGLGEEKENSAINGKLRKTVLEDLVDRELLYQESRRKDLRVGTDAIDGEIDRLKDKFTTPEKFREFLGKNALSEEAVRHQVQSKLAINALVDAEIGSRVVLTENEVRDYYDTHLAEFSRKKEIRLSQILVKPRVHGIRAVREKALSRMKDVQERIVRGEDFADVAVPSVDTDIKVVVGDMGYFQSGRLPEKIERVAFALKPGEVSDIVEDRYGFHLLKVVDIRPETVVPYETAQYRIRKKLHQERVDLLLPDYLRQLRDKSEIIVLMKIKVD